MNCWLQKVIENGMGSKNNLISVKNTDFEVFQALAMDSESGTSNEQCKCCCIVSFYYINSGFCFLLMVGCQCIFWTPNHKWTNLFISNTHCALPKIAPYSSIYLMPSLKVLTSK